MGYFSHATNPGKLTSAAKSDHVHAGMTDILPYAVM